MSRSEPSDAGQAGEPAAGVFPPGRRTATDAERRAMASVVRLRILRMCRYEALTNKEIAARLDRNPATVLHHVRTLVAQGFLVPGEIRRGPRGSREVPYAATGKSWTLDVPLSQSDDVLLRTFLEEVSQVPTVQVQMTRLGLQLSEEHRLEFLDRLYGLLDEFARRDLDPDGTRESLFLAIHPEP